VGPEPGGFVVIRGKAAQNGAEPEGQASAQQWLDALGSGAQSGQAIGIKPDRHPCDFAAFERFGRALCAIEARHPVKTARRLLGPN
jgi:hypothetical protein